MTLPHDLLQLHREVIDGAVLVTAHGEVDLLTAPLLSDELAAACAEAKPAAAVVVADLDGVQFLASAGLSALIEADQNCATAGTPLRLVASNRVVSRVIKLTGMDSVLTLVPSVEAAVAGSAEMEADQV